MIYLLIDTNIIKGSLIDKHSFSNALLQLEQWCQENHITFLKPRELELEWHKHSEMEIIAIQKSTFQFEEKLKTFDQNLSDEKKKDGETRLKSQVQLFSELLENYSINIPVRDEFFRFGHERQKQKIAPFHKNQTSLSDWVIFASTAEYVSINQLTEFYFISGNTKDFSDPNSPQNLHPKLSEIYANCEIHYFTTILQFFEHMYSSEYPVLNQSDSTGSDSRNQFKKTKQIKLTSEAHAINELEKLLSDALTNLDFLHYRHLNEFVFSNFSDETSFNNYVLDTDSEYLINALKSVEKKEGNLIFQESLPFTPSENHLVKLKSILKQLRRNGVYYTEYDYNQTVIHSEKLDECHCIRCKLELFKFIEINPDWKNDKETEFEFYLKRGFSWLRLGNFPKAYSDTAKARMIAKQEKNEMLIFRANYNLSKLYLRLRNNFMIGKYYDSILSELDSIKFNSFNAKGEFNKTIINWMLNENYIQEAYTEINRLKTKIIDAQRISYNGGSSSNNLINQLAFKYSQISSFIQINVFYFEDFIEWSEIADSFIEGVLVSYSTNEGSSRLENLNDWALTEIMKFGNPDKIETLINNCKLKNIKYSSNYNKEHSITALITNLLETDYRGFLTEHFEDKFSEKTFIDKQKKWINNSLVLLGLIDFEPNFIHQAISKIIQRVKRSGVDFDIYKFQSLLVRRANLISLDQIREIIHIGLITYNINPYFYFAGIAEIAKENRVKISLKKENISALNGLISSLSPSNNRALVHLARILNGKQKTHIQNTILSKLTNEDYYSEIPLYLSAVLQNVLDYDHERIKLYINHLTPQEESVKIGRRLSYSEKYNSQLNDLVDVLYKFKIKTNQFQGLLKHSEYYQWLLQVDTFDYTKFDPEWITLHDGFNYNSRFKKSKILKNTLRKYLQENTSLTTDKIRERYHEIYSN